MRITALTRNNALLTTRMSITAFLHGLLYCPGDTEPEEVLLDHLPPDFQEQPDEELVQTVEEACLMAGTKPYATPPYAALRLHSLRLEDGDLEYIKHRIIEDKQMMPPDDAS